MNLLEYIKELKSFLVNESISGSSADEIYEKTNSLNAIKERLTSLINEAQNAGIEFSAIQEGAQNAISSIPIPSADSDMDTDPETAETTETPKIPNSDADIDIDSDTESGGEIPNSAPDADAGAGASPDEIPPAINEPEPENKSVPPREPLIHIPIEPKRPRESASQSSHRPRKFTKPTEIDDLSTPGNTNADTIKMNYDNQLEDDAWSETEPKIPNKNIVSYNFGTPDDNARSYGTGSTNSKTSRWEYKNSSAKGIKNRTKRK